MLVDRGGLWFRVLKAKYGVEGGRNGSTWWRALVQIQNGVGLDVGSWFEENLRRMICDEANYVFWLDPWVGGFHCVLGSRGCFSCHRIGGRQLQVCFPWVGKRVARHEN